jgi:predicted nucleotidyltransferase
MRFISENLPTSLQFAETSLFDCIKAFGASVPVQKIILFGSYARNVPSPSSDVDLCIIVKGLKSQYETALKLRRAIGRIRNKPAFSLLPISPERLKEKIRAKDPFFKTVLSEGVVISEED